MSRVLLMLSSRTNLRLLEEALADRHVVVVFDSARYRGSLRTHDLIVVDGMTLERFMDAILWAKEEALPTFLPVLLVTSRQGVGLATRNLWKSVDEVILTPIERVELQARVEVMLRVRQLSVELYQRNQDMEAFVHAVAHELRAPLRAMAGFARAILEDAQIPEGSQTAEYLRRIADASDEMKGVLDALLTFARLGGEVQTCPVWLEPLVGSCLEDLEQEIATKTAHIECDLLCETVEADPLLLELVLQNLLSNALKFRDESRSLRITVRAYPGGEWCRIEVEDNGIGIPAEDAKRVFTPFTRLHGAEEYPGIGLGLSIVRKAVTCMGGRCGVVSREGEGSIFWVELPSVEVTSHEGASYRGQSERP